MPPGIRPDAAKGAGRASVPPPIARWYRAAPPAAAPAADVRARNIGAATSARDGAPECGT